jgi:3-hydroxybutyryl-CoA dehydrogenase
MAADPGYHRPAIAGSGTIACGLAASATLAGEVWLLARSDAAARRAADRAQAVARKLEGGVPERIRVITDSDEIAGCDLVVEAIVEDPEAKLELLAELASSCAEADLATTTSSLKVGELGSRAGAAGRFFGLHVFNPVAKMELVELCLPEGLDPAVAGRARTWCAALGKTAIEVPDQPGFVVNRLLFPMLFEAVHLMETTGMQAADVDSCMKLGAGHPMGPLRLLDFVGLDVSAAIGDSLHADSGEEAHRPPPLLRRLVEQGKLGRKSGAGFYDYDR